MDDTPRLSHKFFRLNTNSLLSGGLLVLLLFVYLVLTYYVIYAVGVVLLGDFHDPNFEAPRWLNIIAFLIIALTFFPISRWLYRQINDLVYAQHDNPYSFVVSINQQLQTMTNPQLTLPLVVETIATMLYLPYLCLELSPPVLPKQVAFGTAPTRTKMRHFPISYLERSVGMLLVADRSANRPLSVNDQVILQDIAQQIGIALTVTQLTADLQISREQIIIAREEERRRIRNDLHDGLAPTLSSFQLQLGVIRRIISQNPAQAEQMIAELSTGLRQATAEIRQLVYDLRPPMLDELGLIRALNHMPLADAPLQLDVIAPDPMPTLSAATEVAIYRIATEAIHNVVKHAHATTCTISIAIEAETLILTIVDDGQGISAGNPNGIGTQSMSNRAAELGGTFTIQPAEPLGTCIEVRLPWRDKNG